jgi:outer membrane protein OmpA-like peptidoglycan-associated protein
MKTLRLLPLLGLLGVSACAATQPPRELFEARAAYDQARTGPASELALVDLHAARQRLDLAEAAFRDDPGAPQTRDLSYVALRQAQIADARGATMSAERDRERAESERQAALAQRLAQTQGALTRSQQAQVQTTQQLGQERVARMDAEHRAQAALASLRQVAAVREEQRGTVITLSGEVLFATGESTLLPIAQQRLEQVAQAIRDQGMRHLVIEGHTDSRGSAEENQRLSLARANSVRNQLITRGLDGSMIETVGAGASRPVADNDTADGRANNRRVEIVVRPMARAQPNRADVVAPAPVIAQRAR